jgi:hypothetical protein
MSTQDALWPGVDLKLENATFHFEQINRALAGPERTGHLVAIEASGGIIGHDWQRPFYAHFDAFLSATRSVGQVIKCCFGEDTDGRLTPALDALSVDEQNRRRAFQLQFDPHLTAFNQRPLSTSRNISEHRTGYAPVTVTITGLLGVTYLGSPLKRIPTVETRQHNKPGVPFVQSHPLPVRPLGRDFKIDGQPLFPECQAHLEAAQQLIATARSIATQTHGTALTPRR